MLKAFSFLNPIDPKNDEKNWRSLVDLSKFNDFSSQITTGNITNVGSAIGWCQLFGPMCYYYIKLISGGGDMVSAGSGYISGVPYGPVSKSGLKSTVYRQFLEVLDTNGNEIGPNQKGYVDYNAGLPRIYLINAFSTPELYIYGWIYRDA